LTTLENNGATKAFNYGVFLGNRYKNSPNIVWHSGNDFQTWNTNSADNNLVYQVMAGIASADPNHIQTIELNFDASYSNQDTATLGSTLGSDGVYTYLETYDEALLAYNSSPTLPTFLTEANYEYENNTDLFSGTTGPFILREQEYWAMTSGSGGQLYGNHYTWTFTSGWQSFLDSPGTMELAYWLGLFNSVPWWNLVPDQNHQIVTSGYGTYDGSNGNLPIANYATTAWIPDGSLAITYDPAGDALTVNLGEFNQPITATWYDPSNGASTTIAGSPFQNIGSEQFAPPGINHDGDEDWVLVLRASAPSPNLTSLSPTSGAVGSSVTITGTNFGASQGTSTVTFNGTTATPTSWTATSIVAPVPSGATTGNVVVTVGSSFSNGLSFAVTSPGP